MSTNPRRGVYLWVTWLTSLLAGEAQCWWAPWFRGHHYFDKLARGGGDLMQWRSDHTCMVEGRAAQLRADGWKVFIEDQNAFTLKGRVAALGGKPDIVAVRGLDARVIDCKTGKRRESDYWQVLLYMLALPHSHSAISGLHLTGEIQYQDGSLEIPPDAFTPVLRTRILEAIARASTDTPPARVPSTRECGWCDIGPGDCPERVATSATEVAVPELF